MTNELRVNTIIQVLTSQRNDAMNEVVALRVKVAELEQTVNEMKQQLEKSQTCAETKTNN
jgi:predicted ATP-grasp superfamily ATP-dependent carboligase